ncbi:MAG TPA: alpha/beta fold hydrolase [Actinomycetes bacterium]|nr:alpha/beta fold hydrolase [Actinomycetes bacterium]
MRAAATVLAVGALLGGTLAACGSGPDEPTAARDRRPTATAPAATTSPTGSTSPTSPTSLAGTPPVAASPAQRLAMSCRGHARPTVVLVSGLGASRHTFDGLVTDLARRHRVCSYDRAGLGDSPPLRRREPDPWPGNAADELAATLVARGEQPPYVLLGWSYGGLVVQAFTERHGGLVDGLVLEDSSAAEQFVDRAWDHITWDEGGRLVDTRRTVRALRAVDLGGRPTVVLSSDAITGAAGRLWYRYHDRLAASSTDAVHVEVLGAPHAVHEGNQAIVATAVDAVVAAVRDDAALTGCRRTFRPVGGRCLG